MSRSAERTDPYAHVFGVESLDERLFPPIHAEAEARGLPLHDPDRFLFLSSVEGVLRSIAGDGPAADGPTQAAGAGGPGAVSSAEQKAALQHYGRLLYHAFLFWRDRGRRVELSEDVVRGLVESAPSVGDWELRPPGPTGYLRLPRNLFWTAPGPGLPPEPADGFFWVFANPRGEAARLHLLLVLGVRPDRPGFSVVPATGILGDEPHWAEVTGREDGEDFRTALPGGEIGRLYSIETAAELLKLATRAFRHLDEAK